MKKTMKLWDIVLMNVTAVIGLRWITIAASFGAASIFMWIFAACMFFIPLGLVSSELATTWPDEGGIYIWVKEAFGEKPAFYNLMVLLG
jgi:amino acid transporter